MTRRIFLVCLIWLLPLSRAQAHTPAEQKKVLEHVSFTQNLDKTIPLDLSFRDETGKAVQLSNYFHPPQPVVLAMVYYECPMLCTETLNGLTRAARNLPMALGSQYRILTVSINPGETPALAAAKKKSYSERYGRSGAGEGWAFLTGEEKSIRPLADAVGFHYVYDPELKQYAHPTGIVVLTPSGKISHYFFGVEFDPKDLKLSLLQAAEGKIGSPVDRIILSCYHYDPLSGKYNLVIMRVVQLAGLSTVAAIAIMIAVLSL